MSGPSFVVERAQEEAQVKIRITGDYQRYGDQVAYRGKYPPAEEGLCLGFSASWVLFLWKDILYRGHL